MNNNLDVYDFLDEGGLLSKAFPSYEYREGQLEMSLLVQIGRASCRERV